MNPQPLLSSDSSNVKLSGLNSKIPARFAELGSFTPVLHALGAEKVHAGDCSSCNEIIACIP
jgi:hypothetical protein